MRRALLIVNPTASRVTGSVIGAVAAELAGAGEVDVIQTEGPGHATQIAAGVQGDLAALYVLSGDGGYNEVVNGLAASVPVGFLPGGATSVLPRALGLPRDPVACARRLACSRATRVISLGIVNGRRFTFCAGVGLDAELVRAIDRRGRRNGRRPGDVVFALELARLLRARRWRVEPALTVEGYGRAAFVVATTCDPYTYAGPLPVHATPAASFELGIDVVGPRSLDIAGLARLAWSVLGVIDARSSRIRHVTSLPTRSAHATAALIGDTWLTATTTPSPSQSQQKRRMRSATACRLSPPGGTNATSSRQRAMASAGTASNALPSQSP